MDPTDTVIRWAMTTPVLASRLREIALDGLEDPDPWQELNCTVIDLLTPDRDARACAFLRATGARTDHADAAWREMGGTLRMHAVHWERVAQELIAKARTW